jgi:hypothetical protein
MTSPQSYFARYLLISQIYRSAAYASLVLRTKVIFLSWDDLQLIFCGSILLQQHTFTFSLCYSNAGTPEPTLISRGEYHPRQLASTSPGLAASHIGSFQPLCSSKSYLLYVLSRLQNLPSSSCWTPLISTALRRKIRILFPLKSIHCRQGSDSDIFKFNTYSSKPGLYIRNLWKGSRIHIPWTEKLAGLRGISNKIPIL